MTLILMLQGEGGYRPPPRRPGRGERPPGPPRRSALAAAVVALPIALVVTALLVVFDILPILLFVPAYGLIGALIALALILRP